MRKQSNYIRGYGAGAKAVALTALTVLSGDLLATQDWPGESWEDALQLGDYADSFSNGDISGAHWNHNTKTLWLSDNKEEMIWSLVETSTGFDVDKSFYATGDLEGITQAMDDSVIYVMDEDRYIRSFDTTAGNSLTSWEIADYLPTSGSNGPEGITFVPDAWLSTSDFVDQYGARYAESQYDLGGIFLVAHQNGGALYAFDLASDGSVSFIGQYDTARNESSGLEFDRSTGILYISHNVDGNTLETTDLQTTALDDHRKFVTKVEFQAPNDSNLEGFALKPAINDDKTANDVWAFYTDGNGNSTDGNAILVFTELVSNLTVTAGNNQVADALSNVAIPPTVQLKDPFQNSLAETSVSFSINQGGGSLSGEYTNTDNNGFAQLSSWTLGYSGIQQVDVTAGSLSTIINANATADEYRSPSLTFASAGGADGDNIPANVLDDNAETYWSASGDQWLEIHLDTPQTISGVSFEFYKGDTRSAIFDIATSVDGENWTIQLENVYSSGSTTDAEIFYFSSPLDAKYICFIGHGNDASSASTAKWNAIVEAKIVTDNAVSSDNDTSAELSAISSGDAGENVASNVLDDDAKTYWSASGEQLLQLDLGKIESISGVSFAFYEGDTRSAIFDITTSTNGTDWDLQLDTAYSLGNTADSEAFYFSDTVAAKYVRFIGYGNDSSSSATAQWNAITEAAILTDADSGNDDE